MELVMTVGPAPNTRCRDYVNEATDVDDCGYRTAGTQFGSPNSVDTAEACDVATALVSSYCGGLITIGVVFLLLGGGLAAIFLIAFTSVARFESFRADAAGVGALAGSVGSNRTWQ